MKAAAALGAAIVAIAGLSAALRPPRERTVVRERRVEVSVEVPVVVEKIRTEERVIERTRVERVEGPVSEAPDRRMAFLFERELGLGDEQFRHMDRVLRERDVEIEAYHREIRSSGVFRPREYGRRIREIQHASYERIATVLDSGQYRRFRDLLAQGRIGDAVEFTLDPHMAVVD